MVIEPAPWSISAGGAQSDSTRKCIPAFVGLALLSILLQGCMSLPARHPLPEHLLVGLRELARHGAVELTVEIGIVAVPGLDAGLERQAELGHDLGISMPRGLVMPPDVPKEAQDWWIAAMKKVVETPEWKEYIEKQLLTENVLYGEDFRAFLQRTQGTFGDILKKSGAIK